MTSQVVNTEPQCLTLRDAIATPFELVAPTDAPDQPSRHASFKAALRPIGAVPQGRRHSANGGGLAVGVEFHRRYDALQHVRGRLGRLRLLTLRAGLRHESVAVLTRRDVLASGVSVELQ